MLLAFLTGLFLTFLITFMGDGLASLLDEPSESIPALCRGDSRELSAYCPRTGERESEEAAIYSALIMQMEDDERGTLVVVQDRTVSGNNTLFDASEDEHFNRIFESLRQNFPGAERGTLESFRASNLQCYPMTEPFLAGIKTELIGQHEIESFSYRESGSWWEAFYRKHPGATGFFLMSKVGFNGEMNQALVYRAFACGSTCGYGSYVLLVKEAGVWKIRAEAGTWIS
jgi:hypothetical protein